MEYENKTKTRIRRGKLTKSKNDWKKETIKDTIKHQMNNKKDQKEVSMGKEKRNKQTEMLTSIKRKGQKETKIKPATKEIRS